MTNIAAADCADPFNPIEHAGHMLERHAAGDTTVPNLLEVTGVQQHRMATASGLNDYDYQKLSTLTRNEAISLNQIETVSKVPIPPEIMEHFKHIKCHCMMGLFPEIGRAWLTIDSDLYIWTYENGQDVAYFDGVNHLIISVALVRPKPNVFIDDVRHLLIVTTPIEIVVLGVIFSEGTAQMQLMDKPIFTVCTDNVAMTAIVGTADERRILLGGRDGCLYELVYQAESNWFGKRCKKVNHSQGLMSYVVPGFLRVFAETDSLVRLAVDDTRGCLYTLSEKGAIEAWDLAAGEARRIARLTAAEVTAFAGKILRTVDTTIFKPIVSICPLTIADSPHMHLLCVTQDGVRLYFATRPIDIGPLDHHHQQQQQQQQSTAGHHGSPTAHSRPYTTFQLLHVRLPPGYTFNVSVVKPKSVRSAHYAAGNLLMVSTPQQDQDVLWSLSAQPFPLRPYLTESSTVLPLSGQVWSIAAAATTAANATDLDTFDENAPAARVVLLTNQGTQVVAMQRPVHMLQQLLFRCRGPNHEAVRAFFDSMSVAHACAAAVLLACTGAQRNTEIGAWAREAFLLYGGEPHFGGGGGGGSAAYDPAAANRTIEAQQQQQQQQFIAMSTPAQHGLQFQHAQFNQSGMSGTTFGSPIGGGAGGGSSSLAPLQQSQSFQFGRDSPRHAAAASVNLAAGACVQFSHKHTGLYLHASRVLRRLWPRRCLTAQRASAIGPDECAAVLEEMNALRAFIEAMPMRTAGGGVQTLGDSAYGGGHFSLMGQSSYQARRQSGGGAGGLSVDQALAEENRSVGALAALLRYACEVLALWKILCEHQFHLLLAAVPADDQTWLASCHFSDLILAGDDTCAQLIVALINTYLRDNASVGTISEKLRASCPLLYRHEDAVTHKATELLQTCTAGAGPPLDADERADRLHVALQLCRDAAPNVPLSQICAQFRAARFDEGVVQLCAAFAQRLDPTGAALHYYQSREPAEDQEGYAAFAARLNCYQEIAVVLDEAQQRQKSAGGGDAGGANAAGPPLLETVAMCLQTSDQLLHIAVYGWLLAESLYSDLLNITEPSLGEFLAYSFDRQPDNRHYGDILWKYHERNGRHDRATIVLDQLAAAGSEHIRLEQRIEYLARAVMCTRCDSSGGGRTGGGATQAGALLKNLEDKLEVARVQKRILDAVAALAADVPGREDAMRALNYALYDISQLYTDFAEPFELWECKLAILNCSHHNDGLLIESVWSNILRLELQANGGHSGGGAERLARLLFKVRSLGGEYGTAGHCFPVAFLVHELEVQCCKLRQPPGAVPEALLAFGGGAGGGGEISANGTVAEGALDVEQLLDLYGRMISMNERVWATEGNEWHLVESTARLVAVLAEPAGGRMAVRQRRRVVAKAQELMSTCRNLLYPKPETKALIDALMQIEARLQRT